MPNRPRRARPCSLCQTTRVMESKVCGKCQDQFKGQENEAWYQFAIEESDSTARLIRRKNSRYEAGIETVENLNPNQYRKLS